MSARAGTPLAQIEEALARARPDAGVRADRARPAARAARRARRTIGGVFATNLSGARRVRAGAARDHLLGVRAVNGRGEIFKSGGRVMKNVTGVDLCRGLAGSWGTLAVLTRGDVQGPAACRRTTAHADPARPARRDRRRGAVRGDGHALRGLGRRAPAGRRWWRGCGTTALRRQGQAVTALRLENFAKSVAYRIGRLKEHLKAYGEIHELDRENSLAFWGELRQLSVLQGSDAPAVAHLDRARRRAQGGGRDLGLHGVPRVLRLVGRPRLGRGAADHRCRRRRHPPRHRHARRPRHADPRRAAGARRRRGVPAAGAGPASGSRASSRPAFDPAGILNPGRMYANF